MPGSAPQSRWHAPQTGTTPTTPVPTYYDTAYSMPGMPPPPAPALRSSPAPTTILLLLCAVVVIIGSFTPWMTVSFFGQSISVDGNQSSIVTAIGVNGWFTFVTGVVLLLVAAAMLNSRERALRQWAVIVAFVTLGFAVYDMSRVAYGVSSLSIPSERGVPAPLTHFLSSFGVSVGFGLVLLLIAALGAMACAIIELRSA